MHVATECVFCDILNGEEPASFVHEGRSCAAFLSLHQVRPGETVVIPHDHVDHFTDLSDEVASEIMRVAQQIGRTLLRHLKCDRIGYVVHGYGVHHAHLMVVPQHTPTDITSARFLQFKNGEPSFSVSQLREHPREELDDLAAMIRNWIGETAGD